MTTINESIARESDYVVPGTESGIDQPIILTNFGVQIRIEAHH